MNWYKAHDVYYCFRCLQSWTKGRPNHILFVKKNIRKAGILRFFQVSSIFAVDSLPSLLSMFGIFVLSACVTYWFKPNWPRLWNFLKCHFVNPANLTDLIYFWTQRIWSYCNFIPLTSLWPYKQTMHGL